MSHLWLETPPKAKPEKRRRGRPSNASRAQDAPASSPRAGEGEGEGDEDEIATAESPEIGRPSAQSKRRRRGGEVPDDDEDGAPTRKRRGRRGTATGATLEGDEGGEYEDQPKKRGRPRGTAKEKRPEAARGSPDPVEPPAKRKRGRPARPQEMPGGEEDDMDGEPAPKRQRGRPRKSDGSDVAGVEDPKSKRRARDSAVSGAAEPREPGKRGRPRRSDTSDTAPSQPRTSDAVAEPQQPKKRGRTRRSYPSDAAPSQAPTSAAAEQAQEPKKRGRPRRSDASDAGPSQPPPAPDAAAETQEPKRRKRTRRSDASNATADTVDEPPTRRPYTHIASTQREIPVSTITSKWTPLPPPSLALARQILALSERPVLQSLAPGPRRDIAASAIRTASRRLASKLSKGLPFPPASAAARRAATKGGGGGGGADGREAELDFEAVASDMEALERRLDPLLHSIAALRAEEARMEAVIERDAAALGELEKNARGEMGMWRANLRKRGHPLVPDRWDPDGDGAGGLALAPKEEGGVPAEWLFMNVKGSLPLSTLTSHITSLRNNVRPVQNLDRAMADSEAAIRRVLSHALGPESYEAAIMPERS
ncbi:uncharacterized protein DNG_06047 [Cephalotrichum gorgonifer]|uniref:Kinetochore protein fta7 n=1 Tax=Cephalotrichum gorgonifer TaxID=2041049 RepID=A0AAE8N0R1_9PEZI|nr:uncharacterized protein DNG_06047 [Cephalotrichum gorgonifer]